MVGTTTYYPQCWAKLQIRPETFVSDPASLLPPDLVVPGDPITRNSFISLQKPAFPTFCQVRLRSYREGDSCDIELPSTVLPVDPRVIRQGTIQVYMGALDPITYAQTQGQLGSSAKPVLLPEIDPTTGESNEVFRGFFDEMKLSNSENGEIISIQARDLTGFFIDQEFPIGALHGINPATPIDLVIQAMIDGDPAAAAAPPMDAATIRERPESRRGARRTSRQLAAAQRKLAKVTAASATDPSPALIAEINRVTTQVAQLTARLGLDTAIEVAANSVPLISRRLGIPGARGMRVINETGAPLPLIGQVFGVTWRDSLGGVKRKRRGAGRPKSATQKLSYWDFITDMCVGLGLICYIRTPKVGVPGLHSAELVISTPRTYYPLNESVDIRRFQWGHNVLRMDTTRQYTGRDVPTAVAVHATIDETGEPISAVHPPLPARKINRRTASKLGIGDRVEVTTMNLADRIPATLAPVLMPLIAQSVYEQISRREMVIEIETTALSARPSSFLTGFPDMLHLRAADTVDVNTTPAADNPVKAGMTGHGQFVRMAAPDKASYMIARGFPPELAFLLAVAYDNPLLQTKFRVTENHITFDAEEGFSFRVELQNYLVAYHGIPGFD